MNSQVFKSPLTNNGRRWQSLLQFFPILLCTLTLSSNLSADEAKPRYVAGSGEDSGDCRNLFRPCRSLAYAASKSVKGDPVLVTEGEYRLENLDELYLLINTDIKAGMDKISHFSLQKDSVISTLSGVPLEYRETFEKAGFHVIVDSKGKHIDKTTVQHFQQKMQASRANHKSTDCTGGLAASFPCQNINLLAHINPGTLKSSASVASDIWGFVDLNTLREYVIIGLSNGVSVVDVTDPENPSIVGTNDGLGSTWRDIKIWQRWDQSAERWRAFAYVSTEANMGLVVLDLSDLPNSFSQVNYNSDFATAHNVYLANVDYSFGVAHEGAEPLLTVAGSNLGSGRYRLYSLADSGVPQLVEANGRGYMHDAASVQISDARKNTQCVNAQLQTTCKLLADFNEGSVEIWDVSNPDAPVELSTTTYASASYVHSGWWTEDGLYLFVHDELDEINSSLNTTVRIFSMANLLSPQLVETWTGSTRAIDHNGFVRGNRYYISNYVEGLTVLDISDPTDVQRIAWFDTEPLSSSPVFEGAWGVYPFLPSGTLAVSDINSGLYLLQDNSLSSPNGNLAFSQANLTAEEGTTLTIEVQRLNGSAGAASVKVIAHFLSASSDDASLSATTLNWADGDSASKSLEVNLTADALDEGNELLALRLESPTGGATLLQPRLAYVRIREPGSDSILSPVDDQIVVSHGRDSVLVTVQRLGDIQNSASVDWSLELPERLSFSQTTGSLSWEAGDPLGKTVELSFSNKPITQVDFTLRLANPVNSSLNLDSVSIRKQARPVNVTPTDPGGGSNIDNPGSSGGGMANPLLLLVLMLLAARKRRRE